MRAGDAEIDRIEERSRHRRPAGEQGQGIAGHGAVVPRPLEGVVEGAMAAQDGQGLFEVALADLAALEGAPPERALRFVAAPEGQHDRKGDLPLAEIVADVLAEL